MKIAVVDDGVDPENRFFDPAGFSYPAGFPKGGTKWTTPKVIVARAFVGAGADERSRLALDRRASFHGTHVAGIAAGNAGTTAPSGGDHPETPGLSGVAPRAQIGNYRIFNVPTPVGHVGNTPEIVAAFESAVRDGMDVINFSGGGPQTDPASDALVEAVRNVAAAGVVPVISAGNDRDDYGLGSAGSPGTAPDAISVAALSNSHVFAPALSVTAPDAPGALDAHPVRRGRGRPDSGRLGRLGPAARGRRHRAGRRRHSRSAQSLRPARQPRRRRLAAPGRLARGRDRARLARGLHVRAEGGAREGRRRDRHRRRRQPCRRGERHPARARRSGRA